MLPPKLVVKLHLISPLPLVLELRSLSPNRLTLKAVYLKVLLLKLILQRTNHVQFKFYSTRPTRTLFMTTRAPYRYKLTRNQYLLHRYHYIFCLGFHNLCQQTPAQARVLQEKITA